MGCCEYKRMPGLLPEDYFLVEHRLGLPEDCKDGCVYTKWNSEKTEYCFKRSSRYPSSECKNTEIMPLGNCDLATLISIAADNQSYVVKLKTNETGILRFTWKLQMSRLWDIPPQINMTHHDKNISLSCFDYEPWGYCGSHPQEVGPGEHLIKVYNGNPSVEWDTPPMIKDYYVENLNYCGGLNLDEDPEVQAEPEAAGLNPSFN